MPESEASTPELSLVDLAKFSPVLPLAGCGCTLGAVGMLKNVKNHKTLVQCHIDDAES
jgi:hypothetical protein